MSFAEQSAREPEELTLHPWFFEGLSLASRPQYVSVMRNMWKYSVSSGGGWPRPLTAEFVGDFATHEILIRGLAASAWGRIVAAASRHADAEGMPEWSARDGRILSRRKEGVIKAKPLEPQGRAAIPKPGVFCPTVVERCAGVRDDPCWTRFLLLMNTGMRCAESNWRNLRLSDICVVMEPGGRLSYIAVGVRLSKTRKKLAGAVFKYLFPRTDPLDVTRPLLRYLRVTFGIVPRYRKLELGQVVPPVGPSSVSLFPCAAPRAAANSDTEVMRERIRAWAEAAGVVPACVDLLGAHSPRVTITDTLAGAGCDSSFIARVIGWAAGAGDSVHRYQRDKGAVAYWSRANDVLATAYASP